MKKFTTIVLLLCLVFFCVGETTATDSIVRFEGGAENFVFLPDDTDLFVDLKEAMPGDVLSQKINVSNYSSEYDAVKIYLRIETHSDDNPLSPEVADSETFVSMQDYLAQLTMKVYNNGSLIYNNSPDKSGGLTENVLLGEFANGEGGELEIIIEVPVSLGNEYMHRKGEIDFVFTAEEASRDDEPDEPGSGDDDPDINDTPDVANTGRNSMMSGGAVAGSIVGVTIAVSAVVYAFIKRQKR